MDINARIFLAGHKGMVGSALQRVLEREGYLDIVIATRQEVDLRDTTQVSNFFHRTNPEYVLLAAAKVGGIQANRQYPADFIYDNLMIQNNVIHQSYLSGVKKIMFLGSSCVYPKECAQPMKEDYLLTGPLESTNEAYALAKISGLIASSEAQTVLSISIDKNTSSTILSDFTICTLSFSSINGLPFFKTHW